MHIVYLIELTDNIKNNINPQYYIGSKTNCKFVNGRILDSRGKTYYGSSKYLKLNDSDNISITKLYENDDYQIVLNKEKDLHIKHNVVKDVRFVNRSIATENNFTNPDYATYKHISENKIVRLHRKDPDVLNGNFVGVTKGVLVDKITKGKISAKMSGENNPFYGKKHPKNIQDKISNSNRGKKATNDTKLKMSKSRIGVLKSESHKKKIGRPNMIMLKNINTNECVRIPKEHKNSYDLNLWMNPYTVKMLKLKQETKNEN